jgi:hypothetical protein
MNTLKKLSVSKAYTSGLDRLKDNPLFFVTIMMLVLAVAIVSSSLFGVSSNPFVIESSFWLAGALFVFGLGVAVTGELFEFGVKKIALQSVRKAPISYDDIIVSRSQGLRYLVSFIIFNLLVFGLPIAIFQAGLWITGTSLIAVVSTQTGSLVVAIMLGLSGYLALLFHLYPYVLLDRSQSILMVFQDAWTLTAGTRFDLVVFYIVAVILNVAGLLLFGVGLLITVPITIIAQANVYQQLATQSFTHDDA